MMILPFLLPALPPNPEFLESADLTCSQGSVQEAFRVLSEHCWTGDHRAVLLHKACSGTAWLVHGSTPLPEAGAMEFTFLPSGRTLGFQPARSLVFSGSQQKGSYP